MIDPGTNRNGETVTDYCQRRWGGDGWTRSMKKSAKQDGATFSNWKWWPHTLKAHQLIQYCHQECQIPTDQTNQRLFQAEYEKGQNLSDIETLVSLGEELGVTDRDELRTYLQLDHGAGIVQDDIQKGRRRFGISGVPFFVIDGGDATSKPQAFSGAQQAETFVEIFEELADE